MQVGELIVALHEESGMVVGAQFEDAIGDVQRVFVEKGQMGFVVAHLWFKCWHVVRRYVWGIGDDEIPGAQGKGGRLEKVCLEKVDVGLMELRVLGGNGERGVGDVGAEDLPVWALFFEGDRNAPAAGSEIEYVQGVVCLPGGLLQDEFDKLFGFLAWDEYIGVDAKGEIHEVGFPGDVLQRLVAGSAANHGAKGVEFFCGEGAVVLEVEVEAADG